jgi:hypothetical protein
MCAVPVALAVTPSSVLAQSPPANGRTTQARVTFTADFMAKMLKLIARDGVERETAAPIAGALRLSAAGATWKNRQIALQGEATGLFYGFAVSRGRDQDVLLLFRNTVAIRAFRAHRDGTLVGAVSFDIDSERVTVRKLGEAMGDFTTQFRFWASHADDFAEAK